MAKKKTKDKDIKKAEEPKVISKKPTPKPDVVNKDKLDFVDLEEHRKKTGEYHPDDPRYIDSSDLGKRYYEKGDKTANDKLEALKDLAKKIMHLICIFLFIFKPKNIRVNITNFKSLIRCASPN